jgi:hypothetical protein
MINQTTGFIGLTVDELVNESNHRRHRLLFPASALRTS